MTDKWNSYLCRVNGEIASIFLNLALSPDAPVSNNKWLLWVWLYMRNPRPDGLSHASELNTLVEIEKTLCERLLECCSAMLSGTITTQGRREFYFYGSSSEGFERAVQSVINEFEGYRCDTGIKPDPQWTQYLKVLYPSDSDLQKMRTRDVQ